MKNFIKQHIRKANIGMMKRYLLKEQGYEDDVVNSMSYDELKECYDSYHEEW
jgi:hypothetical protein